MSVDRPARLFNFNPQPAGAGVLIVEAANRLRLPAAG
jgi:hypothetical protein